MDDFDSPWLDSDIAAREEAIRSHPAKGFRLPKFTAACPGCGRGANPRMLEVAHWKPESRPLCSACRKRAKNWATPQQLEVSRAARAKREALGIAPNPGGSPL